MADATNVLLKSIQRELDEARAQRRGRQQGRQERFDRVYQRQRDNTVRGRTSVNTKELLKEIQRDRLDRERRHRGVEFFVQDTEDLIETTGSTIAESEILQAEEIIARRRKGYNADPPSEGDTRASKARRDDAIFKSHWSVSPTRIPRYKSPKQK